MQIQSECTVHTHTPHTHTHTHTHTHISLATYIYTYLHHTHHTIQTQVYSKYTHQYKHIIRYNSYVILKNSTRFGTEVPSSGTYKHKGEYVQHINLGTIKQY